MMPAKGNEHPLIFRIFITDNSNSREFHNSGKLLLHVCLIDSYFSYNFDCHSLIDMVGLAIC